MEELDPTTVFIFKVTWLIGIATSCVGLLLQIILLVLIPRCRKFDEKVLTNMMATRIINTICEYYFLNNPPKSTNVDRILIDASLVISFCTDFVLVLWMFVFTKNLYDKIVAVFVLDKWNFAVITSVIWLVSCPIGLLFLVVIKQYRGFLLTYHRAYYGVKLIILIINALFFIRILLVARSKRKVKSSRNVRDVIRTTVGAFILLLTNVLQVLSTDVLVVINNRILTMTSSVFNSFHVIPVMAIFILLVKAKLRGSILRHVSSKITRLQLVTDLNPNVT